ncbi:hypothetical protein JOD43_001801 [Pullulanibacillus pueri]|uniref:DUF4367 domain-containing protein n=1 Tax=Pullulanibacillus pueri TaxID=1437324 RepID=A0A8J2ZUJ2_9BACL|nr:hypothetical protein [Pullulanibacillus pueri]MBM7681634.1 hypothetical protein [Pullulanibacillus pueri]GGH79370.1 hypothetical protein GCM10007096_14190 [Pullulanibacillus pueri]
MDEQLERLKEIMDQTILKEGAFQEKDRLRVLNRIHNRKSSVRKTWIATFSTVLCLGLLMVLSYSIFFQGTEQQASQQSSPSLTETSLKKASSEQQPEVKANKAGTVNAEKKDVMPYKYSEDLANPKQSVPKTLSFNHYTYKNTGNHIGPSGIGESVGKVNLSDESQEKKAMKTTLVYTVKGKELISAIAISIGDKDTPHYLVFERDQNPEGQEGAKDQSDAMQQVLQKASQSISLYVFSSSQASLKLAEYKEEWGPGVFINYTIRDVSGQQDVSLSLKEYRESKAEAARTLFTFKTTLPSDRKGTTTAKDSNAMYQPAVPTDSFESNGVKWSFYKDYQGKTAMLGEKADYAFEIVLKHSLTKEEARSLVESFKPYEK